MIKNKRPIVTVSIIGLALAVVGLTAVLAIGVNSPPVEATSMLLPPVPHTLDGRDQCLQCHAPGGVKPVPADHQGRTDATCKGCHSAGSNQGTSTQAAPITAAPTAQASSGDAACIGCHGAPLSFKLANGETISATVSVETFKASAHGGQIGCIACHPEKASGYPHPKPAAADSRGYTAAAAQQCVGCHSDAAQPYAKSVHGKAVAGGNANAATCVDCHGAHNVSDPSRLARRPQLCAGCHAAVSDTYQKSVHGQLLAQGRADAASCLSCHTEDNSGHSLLAIGDPGDPVTAKNVGQTCGACHKQELKTYETTFHGRAMRLGTSGRAPSCVDCHGAFGVQRVHGPEKALDEAKFATTCAQCHTGATESFASGWMGHEEASPGWFPMVFFTERFLFFLTTSVVAFGIVHVELDLLRHIVRRRKVNGNGKEEK